MHPSATPAYWNERWENGQIAFHESVVNPLLERFWIGGERVLVPLCGRSEDLHWLAARAEVTGVELSPVACAALLTQPEIEPEPPFTRYRQGNLTVLQGDFFDLEGHFDTAWDRAALIALPDELRPRYAAHLRRLARRVLLVSFVYDPTRRDGPPFSVGDEEVRRLFPDARLLHREPAEARWESIGGAENVVWSIGDE